MVFVVTSTELKRLKDTYKRLCPVQHMNLNVFIREVLGDGVPHAIAEVSLATYLL